MQPSKKVRSKMELSKINKVAKFALNLTVALKYYSPTTSNEKNNTYNNRKRCYRTSKRKG
jgi:hypothetical protein